MKRFVAIAIELTIGTEAKLQKRYHFSPSKDASRSLPAAPGENTKSTKKYGMFSSPLPGTPDSRSADEAMEKLLAEAGEYAALNEDDLKGFDVKSRADEEIEDEPIDLGELTPQSQQPLSEEVGRKASSTLHNNAAASDGDVEANATETNESDDAKAVPTIEARTPAGFVGITWNPVNRQNVSPARHSTRLGGKLAMAAAKEAGWRKSPRLRKKSGKLEAIVKSDRDKMPARATGLRRGKRVRRLEERRRRIDLRR